MGIFNKGRRKEEYTADMDIERRGAKTDQRIHNKYGSLEGVIH
jgi:hypothetical protein